MFLTSIKFNISQSLLCNFNIRRISVMGMCMLVCLAFLFFFRDVMFIYFCGRQEKCDDLTSAPHIGVFGSK